MATSGLSSTELFSNELASINQAVNFGSFHFIEKKRDWAADGLKKGRLTAL
jgi:hypothetical protein